MSDHTIRGSIVGLNLSNSLESLTAIYLSTIQALAFSTKHILEKMNEKGYQIKNIFITGGLAKNEIYIEQVSSICQVNVIVPKEKDAVLLGCAILASSSFRSVSIFDEMQKMSQIGKIVSPSTLPSIVDFFHKKYKVFLEMYEDQKKYKQMMN